MTDETVTVEAPQPESVNTSLRDELAKAVADARARHKENREFINRDQKPKAEAVTEETETAEVAEVAEEQPEVEAQAEVEETEAESSEGPSWLPKEDRELFGKAPKNVREAWERNFKALQGNYTRATQELKEKSTSLDRFGQALSPVSNMIRAQNATPEQAVAYLANEYARFAANPKDYVTQLARSVGLSVDAANAQQAFESGLEDPRIKSLEQRLNATEQRIRQETLRTQQLAAKSVEDQIASFRDEKGADGNQLRPHFSRVENAMAPFVAAGLTLQQAYDKAVRADDELFEQIVAERSQATLKKPPARKVTTKPNASGSGHVVAKRVEDMSLREQLEHSMQQARVSR